MMQVISYGTLGDEQFVPIHPEASYEDDYPYSWPKSSSNTTTSTETADSYWYDESCSLLSVENDQHYSCSDSFFYLLGFNSNPVSDRREGEDVKSDKRNSKAADVRLSMLSNFSTAYNVISISIALSVMARIYTVTSEAKALCSSSLIAGMIIGQLLGGAVGDLVGRHKAMAIVLLLQVASAFFSAFSCDIYLPFFSSLDEQDRYLSIYEVLAFWRFILGLGCGGVYPLAATLTSESGSSALDKSKLVALTFSFQGIGYAAANLLSWLVVCIFGESDWTWRIILGAGFIPGAILTLSRLRASSGNQTDPQKIQVNNYQGLDEDPTYENVKAMPSTSRTVSPRAASVINAVLKEKNLIVKLIGTAGTWLLFDVVFYGNTLFQPVVLAAAFGKMQTLQATARDSLLISLMALPGYFVTVVAIGYQSPRSIQIQGFFVMGILYLCIGVLFNLLTDHQMVLLVLYGSTFFFSNYGPNATTFMLPSITFSRDCRSTLNGVCAASGKAGALIGASVFISASNEYGQITVFFCCAGLSFIGCIITLCCVRGHAGQQDESILLPHPDEDDCIDRAEPDSENVNSVRQKMKTVHSEPCLLDYR